MTAMELTRIFYLVDDFARIILPEFRKKLIGDGKNCELKKTVYPSQKSSRF